MSIIIASNVNYNLTNHPNYNTKKKELIANLKINFENKYFIDQLLNRILNNKMIDVLYTDLIVMFVYQEYYVSKLMRHLNEDNFPEEANIILHTLGNKISNMAISYTFLQKIYELGIFDMNILVIDRHSTQLHKILQNIIKEHNCINCPRFMGTVDNHIMNKTNRKYSDKQDVLILRFCTDYTLFNEHVQNLNALFLVILVNNTNAESDLSNILSLTNPNYKLIFNEVKTGITTSTLHLIYQKNTSTIIKRN